MAQLRNLILRVVLAVFCFMLMYLLRVVASCLESLL